MKEKIAQRIEEVKVWGELCERLGWMEDGVREEIEAYESCLETQYPDGGEAVKDTWEYKSIQIGKMKLAAYESIRAVILKAMG